MTRTTQVISEAVNILESNISDPNNRRSNDGGRWIYDHFPKYGKNAVLPRIGIHKISSSHPQVSLGSTKSRTEADIQFSIMTRKGTSYDIDNDGSSEPAEQVNDYLHDKVKTVIRDNHDQIENIAEDVAYLIPVNSETITNENSNIILEALSFEVRIDEP